MFEIDVQPASPAFTWIGCVVAPEGTTLNSVAPLPHGGFVATNPYNRSIPDARNRAGKGEAAGEVREWEPGKGWTIVPGSESAGPNGIEVSPDGAWLYINLWPARRMMRAVARADAGQEGRGRCPLPSGQHALAVEWHAHQRRPRRTDDGAGHGVPAGHVQ